MFYNTGSSYNPVTGAPDTGDLTSSSETDPPNLGGTRFGGIDIHGNSVVSLTGMTSGPFNGMLFYQRRFNQQDITITDGADGALLGTLYAKWANLHLSGKGHYDFAIVAGTVSVSGGATVNLHSVGIPIRTNIQPVRMVE